MLNLILFVGFLVAVLLFLGYKSIRKEVTEFSEFELDEIGPDLKKLKDSIKPIVAVSVPDQNAHGCYEEY